MKPYVLFIAVLLVIPSFAPPATASESGHVLIKNARVFDGVNEKLAEGMSVLVTGNKIVKIAASIVPPADCVLIDAANRVLMPGLIDAHWHTTYNSTPASSLMTEDISYVAIIGLKSAEATLMRGFTTVRDVGGNPFAIKRVTDEGLYPGPRIFPSGPPISQTSGHFDFRAKNATPANASDPLDYWSRNSLIMTADGVPEILKRVREVLRMGASQVKIATGGGVSSTYDPLDVQEYTFEEIRAAVQAADAWNTYVAAHVFTDKAAQTSIRAGVKSLEHGFLVSDETLQLMKKKDVWLSLQPLLNDEDALKFDNENSTKKYEQVTQGTDRVYKAAKRIGVKIAFGTDMLFDPVAAAKQGKYLAKLGRWFTPYETLKMATSTNAQLLALCGPRTPYPNGALGVIQEGAYADLLLVEGNPLKDLDLVADAQKNFVLIMKDGVIYKNTIR